ncbi:unnamed protein product [Mytilus edulis]|uniref:Uncharacterized protein n=1 Tax=Mytilus edulis TaxID=6550 RepID=A0A8S3SP28_MYTED|nr:unnamed protein product [Mytilus edulis]
MSSAKRSRSRKPSQSKTSDNRRAKFSSKRADRGSLLKVEYQIQEGLCPPKKEGQIETAGKLASALEDEGEVIDDIVGEECELCSSVMDCYLDLIQFKERHIRSLEVLKQDVNQDVFVSIIRSKLPEDVLLQLEIQKGAKAKWKISSLCEKLQDYVVAREKSDKTETEKDRSNSQGSFNGSFNSHKPWQNKNGKQNGNLRSWNTK